MKNPKPEIRYLNDMGEVIYDKKWLKNAENIELYYMYRGVKKRNGLRYDITVIPPRLLGREFSKTKGHEHIGDYGELYVTLKGKAIYLLQKYRNNKIEDVYAVKAGKGEVVIIPPKYGHITINPSRREELKTANWLSLKSQHIYDIIDKKRGACYYYTDKGWIKNKRYRAVPSIYFKKPLKSAPKSLDFLK